MEIIGPQHEIAVILPENRIGVNNQIPLNIAVVDVDDTAGFNPGRPARSRDFLLELYIPGNHPKGQNLPIQINT